MVRISIKPNKPGFYLIFDVTKVYQPDRLLVALSGALAAQYQGQADVNLGRGVVIMGLASVMIGEFLIKSNKIAYLTLRVLLGSIAFRGIMFLARNLTFLSLRPSDLQLIYGLSIVLLLIITRKKEMKRKRAG